LTIQKFSNAKNSSKNSENAEPRSRTTRTRKLSEKKIPKIRKAVVAGVTVTMEETIVEMTRISEVAKARGAADATIEIRTKDACKMLTRPTRSLEVIVDAAQAIEVAEAVAEVTEAVAEVTEAIEAVTEAIVAVAALTSRAISVAGIAMTTSVKS
jgi:hypothetical protein